MNARGLTIESCESGVTILVRATKSEDTPEAPCHPNEEQVMTKVFIGGSRRVTRPMKRTFAARRCGLTGCS